MATLAHRTPPAVADHDEVRAAHLVTSGDEPFKGIAVQIESVDDAREALRRLGVDL